MDKDKVKNILVIAITLIAIAEAIFIVFKLNGNSSGSGSSSADTGALVAKDENNLELKSSKGNKIEVDGIEAEDIKVQLLGNQVEVKIALKNNSNEALNGFKLELKLLDKDGNAVTTAHDSSEDSIAPGETKEFVSYVNGVDHAETITSARISKFVKKGAIGTAEDSVNSLVKQE